MSSIRIDTRDTEVFLHTLKPRMDSKMRAMSADLGRQTKDHMVELIQEFTKSGLLEASVRLDVLPEGFSVYPTVYYAKIVNDGAGPHAINGRPFLMFVKDGRLVFTKHVNHPGFKGKHFVESTFDWLSNELDIRLQQVTLS